MIRRSGRIYIPIGAIMVLVLAHALGWSQWAERGMVHAVGWVVRPFSRAGARVGFAVHNLGGDLASENSALRERVLKLEAEHAAYLALQNEAAALRTAQKISQSVPLAATPARLIGRETASGRSVVVVDRGSRDGIGSGDAAITPGGFLFGMVIEAKENTSMVLLLTDEASRVAAGISEHPETIGVAEGGYGLVIHLGLIPLDAKIERGNLVITSAGAPRVPAGLVIGRIDEVRQDPHSPFQTAVVSPFYTLESAERVLILHP